MNRISIYLENGTFEGNITLKSSNSHIIATRAKREDINNLSRELDNYGVYFLLIRNNEIYVGMSGLDTVYKRIQNTHSNDIDSSWHTVIGFITSSRGLSDNQLRYIENALCEYVNLNSDWKNKNTSPSRNICNEQYRNSHYGLNTEQIQTCKQYIDDIKYYINNFLINSMFVNANQAISNNTTMSSQEISPSTPSTTIKTRTFFLKNNAHDSYGKAEIQIHSGKAIKTILKKGSKISTDFTPSCPNPDKIQGKRNELINNRAIIDRVLQIDIEFDSPSGAGRFLNGSACNGNHDWKTQDRHPLKEFLN